MPTLLVRLLLLFMLRIWNVCISGVLEGVLVTMTTYSPSSKVVDIGPLVTLSLGEETPGDCILKVLSTTHLPSSPLLRMPVC